jgi:hypothetical protein
VATLVVIAGTREAAAEGEVRADYVPLDEWEFVGGEDSRSAEADRYGGGDDEGPDLDKYLLWRVIKEQVAILRRELSDKDESAKTTEQV